MNGKDRAAFWRERIKAWKQSGQSRTAFAAGHGIDRWTLGRWIRRLTSDGSSASGHRDRPRDKPMTQSAPPDLPSMKLDTGLSIWKKRWKI